jgi:hypothetical protein
MAETLRNVGGTSGAEQPQNSPGFSDSAPEVPPTFRSLCNPDGPGSPLRRFVTRTYASSGPGVTVITVLW